VHHLPLKKPLLEVLSILSGIGLLTCLLACTGHQSVGTQQSLCNGHGNEDGRGCDGYDRGPGSFCALNPEACPPLPPPSDKEPKEELDGAAGKSACLDACEAGGEVLANFCRRLKSPRRQAICWAATHGSKAACIPMCHAIYM
jgi:hypothetical protein